MLFEKGTTLLRRAPVLVLIVAASLATAGAAPAGLDEPRGSIESVDELHCAIGSYEAFDVVVQNTGTGSSRMALYEGSDRRSGEINLAPGASQTVWSSLRIETAKFSLYSVRGASGVRDKLLDTFSRPDGLDCSSTTHEFSIGRPNQQSCTWPAIVDMTAATGPLRFYLSDPDLVLLAPGELHRVKRPILWPGGNPGSYGLDLTLSLLVRDVDLGGEMIPPGVERTIPLRCEKAISAWFLAGVYAPVPEQPASDVAREVLHATITVPELGRPCDGTGSPHYSLGLGVYAQQPSAFAQASVGAFCDDGAARYLVSLDPDSDDQLEVEAGDEVEVTFDRRGVSAVDLSTGSKISLDIDLSNVTTADLVHGTEVGTSFVDHVVRDVRVGGVGLADLDGVLRFNSNGSGELVKILTSGVAPDDSFTFNLKR